MFGYAESDALRRETFVEGADGWRFTLRPCLFSKTKIELKQEDFATSTIEIDEFYACFDENDNDQGPSSHGSCGYGCDRLALVSFKQNGKSVPLYGKYQFWSGCLSYSMNDRESTMSYSDDVKDLFDECTPEQRLSLSLIEDDPRVNAITSSLSGVLQEDIIDKVLLAYCCIRVPVPLEIE
jgi:hypothetical protein